MDAVWEVNKKLLFPALNSLDHFKAPQNYFSQKKHSAKVILDSSWEDALEARPNKTSTHGGLFYLGSLFTSIIIMTMQTKEAMAINRPAGLPEKWTY